MIRGIEGMSDMEVLAEVRKGGRFVIFMYCVSVVVMTFKRSSDVYFIKAGESSLKYSLPWTLLTLLVGWWGVPWGPIYSVQCLYKNLSGGEDVTSAVTRRPD